MALNTGFGLLSAVGVGVGRCTTPLAALGASTADFLILGGHALNAVQERGQGSAAPRVDERANAAKAAGRVLRPCQKPEIAA